MTPAEKIREAVKSGAIALDCERCKPAIEALRAGGQIPFGPDHQASPRCRSGQRPHCTCDTCF